MRALRNDERGSASVSMLLIFPPVLVTLLLITISAGLYYYGGNAAVTIAQTGASAAAAERGSTAACERAASQLAGQLSRAIHDVSVRCSRGATTVTVTVTGTPVSLVSVWAPTVTHTATVAVERVTGP